MATNFEDYKIHLHYLLNKEGVHVMDAKVHNECERHFLRALYNRKIKKSTFKN